MKYLKNKQAGIIVLVILHVVGAIGLTTPWKDWFAQLTPVNLMITATFLFLNHNDWSLRFLSFIAGVFALSWLIELAGVQSGLIFGEYAYGENLGPKWWGTPPLIGLNWLMLIYSIGVFTEKFKGAVWLKAVLGALLMVGLDVFIEPVAMQLDFWNWPMQVVPMQNYLSWWMISFVFFLAFHSLKFEKNNPIAIPLIAIQSLFFIVNNLTL